jgi:hypothetical protein
MKETHILIQDTINECLSSIEKNNEGIDIILDHYSNEPYEDQIMIYLSQLTEIDTFIIDTLEKVNHKFNGEYEEHHVTLLYQAQDFIDKKIKLLDKINKLK